VLRKQLSLDEQAGEMVSRLFCRGRNGSRGPATEIKASWTFSGLQALITVDGMIPKVSVQNATKIKNSAKIT